MRSFLPYTFTLWVMFLVLTILAPAMQHKLPQPWWALMLFGSWALMIWSMYSKEKWLR